MFAACKRFGGGTLPDNMKRRLGRGFSVPSDLRLVAQTFKEVQEKRLLADYDPQIKFCRTDVLAVIRSIDQAVSAFRKVKREPETRFFFTCLLTWKTLETRK
jgi:hypothetical protein